MKDKKFQKLLRLQRANALLATISVCGRQFFRQGVRISHFEIADNGRLYFRDKYSDRSLPCSHTKARAWQRHFSEGGTLKSLVESLAGYVRTGEPVNPFFFGPWSPSTCNGDLWGYGDDMAIVRGHAQRLGIVSQEAH